MSIKKLFESTDKSTNYLSDTTEKEIFEEVESARNVEAIAEKQKTYIPHVDYSDPSNFVKYGSAYLYYKSAIERIIDYYPYDGSDAEVNEFYNKSLDIEKYIFNNHYPRTNGYAVLSSQGWGTKISTSASYSNSDSDEYITFYGGPSSGSYTTLAGAFSNPTNNKPAQSTIYDTDIYTTAKLPTDYGHGTRESNLKSDFDKGVTVEFWFKTGSVASAGKSQNQVIFDLWNNAVSSSADYGRITIAIRANAAGTPFRITALSGSPAHSNSKGIQAQSIGNNITTTTISDWKHYAFVFYNTGSGHRDPNDHLRPPGSNEDLVVKLYVDGVLNDTNLYTSSSVAGGSTAGNGAIGELNSKNMIGRIGALQTAPSGTVPGGVSTGGTEMSGYGKLSGSIDEFRFWKVRRTSHQIAKNWFTHVRGGTNTDISNTTLGVYYKFNEGITQTSSIDSNVLDYSGRITNGTWTGYVTSSRNIGSAIVSASAASSEYKDPIIRTYHPDVAKLKSGLLNSGSYHDSTNISSVVSLLPSWIIEEQESNDGNIQKLSHVLGAYFDKLHLLISQVPKFRNQTYTSASHSPLPFAQHMPQSLGLYTPEIFVDSDVLERFMNRTQTKMFEGDLTETKNLIYLNLYNNLANIYKAKGTEKAIRNVFSCFNINENIVKLNAYADNQVYELKNNLVQTLVNKSSINFSQNNHEGVVYQAVSASNPNARGYISGSSKGTVHVAEGAEDKYGFTVETDIRFPGFRASDPIDRSFEEVSLFGMGTVYATGTAGHNGTNTTWLGGYGSASYDYTNFQVFAVRDAPYSKNVYFKISSSYAPNYFPTLTSSVFFGVYDDQRWNISVRLRPKNPFINIVSGAVSPSYDLVFQGVNSELGTVQNSFTMTASLAQANARNILRAPKRLYAGARKTNITGTVLQKSDVYFSNIRYWAKSLEDRDLQQHIFDIQNRGISGSYQHISPKDPNLGNPGAVDVLNSNMLVLDWSFDDVTGSSDTGNFYVTDMSSGSVELQNNYGWVGSLYGYQHTGYGTAFSTSSTDVVPVEKVNSYKFVDPERVISSDMIQIVSEDEKVFGVHEVKPDYIYSLEKSMYNAISEEMLTFFAGAVDFNNIIGEPVNRYRDRYKTMEKLREIFFRRVSDVKQVEKYMAYYKWFDDALAEIIEQLIPASSGFVGNSLNIIESHVLERNKYQTKFPTLEFKADDPGGIITGWEFNQWNWIENGVPVPTSPRKTTERGDFWLKRANRDSPEITTGTASIDNTRELYRRVSWSVPTLTASSPLLSSFNGSTYVGDNYKSEVFANTYNLEIDNPRSRDNHYRTFKAGTNFTDNKNIHFTYNAVYPAGPVNTENNVFVPTNVLLGFAEDMTPLPETSDWEIDNRLKTLVKRYIPIKHGRDYKGGLGYSNVKSSFAFPFNIISSSVKTGYNKHVIDTVTSSMEITNLHHDTYGEDMEIPLQGPFTNYAVGGHQSRHVRLNTGSDNYRNRPEAWKLILGGDPCFGHGAVGLASADYPWPEANTEGDRPYPMTASQKAVYYRDELAKRPVNIRNIHLATSSNGTILGNYDQLYDVVNSVGAFLTPRRFVDQRPDFTQVFNSGVDVKKANIVGNFMSLRRTDDEHFDFGLTYAPTQFTGSGQNRTIIVGRFRHQGGPEVMSRGFQDIRGSEYSQYNAINYRNLTVLKPSQGSSGSAEPIGEGIPGIRVFDIHGRDYGLYSHLSRHTARFGRDSLHVTAANNLPGASYDQLPGYHKIHRNTRTRIQITNDGGAPTGRAFSQWTVATSSQHDNWYVQHQIPRSDKQYSWFSSSLKLEILNDPRYFQFAPMQTAVQGYYSTSVGYVSYFDFTTASSVPVNAKKNNNRQPIAILNILTVDPVSSSTDNTIGYSLDTPIKHYFNLPLFNSTHGNPAAGMPPATRHPDAFNLLMSRRKNTFGWNWRKNRQSDHPVLLKERKENVITVVTGSLGELGRYRLTPISMKGKPVLININLPYGDSDTTTLKVTNANQEIYFEETELNNIQFPLRSTLTTPYNKVLDALSDSGHSIQWLLYSEALYPSTYNEFFSSSIQRSGYDNLFWRDDRTKRDAIGVDEGVLNSFSTVVSGGAPNLARYPKNSCWPLDAQDDFLTRIHPVWKRGLDVRWGLFSSSAGELQNSYFHALPISTEATTQQGFTGPAAGQQQKVRSLSPAALYARKHLNPNPRSVVSPVGHTGSNPLAGLPLGNNGFLSGNIIDLYAGEALWEAPEQAGIVVKTGSTVIFKSYPSEPWFNTYEDFSYELKLTAKDFTIVPEFRISEHVEDYEKLGLFNEDKTDTFEIVGTGINSSGSGFYKDYSNSDFMSNFLNIKEDTLLNATEIKLVCSAAIRFNPYKGFYPAQRTINLVSQFSSSYADSFAATGSGIFIGTSFTHEPPDKAALINQFGGGLRPLMQTLCSPGILYNSIKSGMAVDYPLLLEPEKIGKYTFSSSLAPGAQAGFAAKGADDLALGLQQYWALTCDTGSSHHPGADGGWNGTGSYFDSRVPFEAIIAPEKYIRNIMIPDMEPHQSAALNVTASIAGAASDEIYSRMASNFFGEVGSFFLKGQTFTKLESGVVADDLRFPTGSVYGARLKVRRSAEGNRTYEFESSSWGDNQGFSRLGGARYGVSRKAFITGSSVYPLPQDPYKNGSFRENFTMYSRPSAFGPAIAGRPSGSQGNANSTTRTFPLDCFNGFNWAYTPPYYYGEAWVDFIFWPDSSKSYDLEQILAETEVIYRRVDPGPTLAGPAGSDGGTTPGKSQDGLAQRDYTSLIADWPQVDDYDKNIDGSARLEPFKRMRSPYQGRCINSNAMQVSASLNLFGVETIFEEEEDSFGRTIKTVNKSVGKRWVIQPKFETPMLNFSDRGVRPITTGSNTLTLPSNYGSSSVPRGMWHQFGTIPESPQKGIFMEIGDIPTNWLKNHYDVRDKDTAYNEFNSTKHGNFISAKMKSLTDLMGFSETSKRLGELAEARTIREAIVAVPYVIESVDISVVGSTKGELATTKKSFIDIPAERYDAALESEAGSADGDSLDAAGESIRKLLQKMDRYVLPPQFDFKNNDSVDPVVMYMFEFEYKLDRDDLSYIWQNLAPRNYKKMTFQVQSVAHELISTELLDEANIMDNENLRWMVFKVKQKAQTEYDDQIITQAGRGNKSNKNRIDRKKSTVSKRSSRTATSTESDDYTLAFNWPYDYVSFVEMVKFEAEVLYSGTTAEERVERSRTSTGASSALTRGGKGTKSRSGKSTTSTSTSLTRGGAGRTSTSAGRRSKSTSTTSTSLTRGGKSRSTTSTDEDTTSTSRSRKSSRGKSLK
jgi:hypothetical protein